MPDTDLAPITCTNLVTGETTTHLAPRTTVATAPPAPLRDAPTFDLASEVSDCCDAYVSVMDGDFYCKRCYQTVDYR